MSAPDTDLETQERRHRPVLVTLRVLIAAAALALLGFAAWQMFAPAPPPEAAFGEPSSFEPGGQASAAVD
ncbi:hypothetical protein P6F26_06480 [Roseibacterium sp. SDUM158017]|uniref:hypothetical protein n=1 Tax=Roseicyclus salinarum TaxID=3036773 RepID=UPI0024156A0E|nr:hypothetical protein [Roseibacterium sp. SDUM158017]MDG4648082.1 hypothetical protein [Roseibacterium sp. SDUM158017]